MGSDLVNFRHSSLIAVVCMAGVSMQSACTEPRVVETSLEACRNGLDDDDDGLVDCDDPACAESGACERSLERCRNGFDDDRDGQIDCQDEQCKPFCGNIDVACEVGTAAACAIGMSCYPKKNTFVGAYCARTGKQGDGQICAESDDCLAGSTCYGLCGAVCTEDAQCTRGSYCAHQEKSPGACLWGCVPGINASGCSGGAECITLHHFAIGSSRARSIAVCSRAPAWTGLAALGAGCDDPPSTTKLERMCAPGLVCWPDGGITAGSGICRQSCGIMAALAGATPCSTPAYACRVAFPADQRPLADGRWAQGLCLPQ
jgi:hypothetical protein